MGRSFAFLQPRGGVGKSTTVTQLAAALAVSRPDLTVTVLDASIHADSSIMLLGGLQEPKNDAAARSHGEELRARVADKSFLTLVNALAGDNAAGAAAAPAPVRTGWGRLLGTAAAPPPVTVAPTAATIAQHAVRVSDVYPEGGAPTNMFLVPGGATLKDMANDVAVRGSASLGTAFAGAPETHVYLLDTDAEICERAASACAAAAAQSLALLSSANWSDFLRALTDPINSITVALAPPFPPKTIDRVVFTRVAKTRNETTAIEGANVSPFKPVNAASDNIHQIIAYAYERARPGGPLAPYMTADGNVTQFVNDHVVMVPEVAENIIVKSVLRGTPVAYMAPGGGVTADTLMAAQEQLAFSAARLL
jgi:MinD-like ATPase involved in chromosome partitioning or flagellar assembly